MKKRIFGGIPGIIEGDCFENRIELSLSKVHSPRQAGISGSQNEGADSIVISGGYEDDEDYGDTIIYTGHGGRDLSSGKQVTDQELNRGNLALALNCQKGLPVRVIRGSNINSDLCPDSGYRYDGLFRVEDYWKEKGKSGYNVWRFRLTKISQKFNEEYILQNKGGIVEENEEEYQKTTRIETTFQRIIRDTTLARTIKELYRHKCQICGVTITTNAGNYSEAAHIKPLGAPHNGPDRMDNILCLCPNHHVQFDFGGIAISDDMTLLGIEGKLSLNKNHKLNIEFIEYHRVHFYLKK